MEDRNVVYVLGAGCSKEDGAPLIREFLEVAFKGIHESYEMGGKKFEELERLREEELPQSNVEEFLSYVVLAGILAEKEEDKKKYSTAKRALINLIRKTLNDSLGTEPSKNYKPFYENHITGPYYTGKSTVTTISFNWDIGLDNVITQGIDYGLKKQKPLDPYESEFQSKNGNQIALLKLHGSLNWAACLKCNTQYVTLNKKILSNIHTGEEIRCPNPDCDGTPTKPLFVPPTLNKMDKDSVMQQIVPIWNKASEAIINATDIFIVGYSFPEDDIHFKLFLRGSLTKNFRKNKREIRIWIVNYKKYHEGKEEFEGHCRKIVDIPKVEIRPRFRYMKFSEFAKMPIHELEKRGE